MEFSLIIVLGLLAIAVAAILGPRLGVAAPLLLVMVGIAVSLLPFVPAIEIEPHLILAGVLPPLLYSASVSMPAMDFRREFTAISGLSVILVVISAVILGLLFSWLIPGLGLATGIALGAIVSPTDAVATAIVRQVGVSPRIVAVLEGESLLNDATALVLLRAAIAAMAASVSLWGVLGDFVYAVVIAVAIGVVVGKLNLIVRSRVKEATVNSIISFTVPFVAALPAEELGASGLVAAVVAGLITGQGAIRYLSPQHRMSDAQNWRAIELVLEGAVFLIMGLEIYAIVEDLSAEGGRIGTAFGLSMAALVLVLVVRAAYVAPLLGLLRRSVRRAEQLKPIMETIQERISAEDFDAAEYARARGKSRPPSQQTVERFQTRIRRQLADIDYFLAEPLGWREGTILVWAGLRGVVTLAAAQTLPQDTPHRALLVFVAFLVAVSSLIIQGGTLPWVVRAIKPAGVNLAAMSAERARLRLLLMQAAERTVAKYGPDEVAQQFRDLVKRMSADPEDSAESTGQERYRHVRFEVIKAQREVLLAVRDDGTFSASTLESALDTLDADQISMELRAESSGG